MLWEKRIWEDVYFLRNNILLIIYIANNTNTIAWNNFYQKHRLYVYINDFNIMYDIFLLLTY